MSRGVLGPPPSRGTTVVCGAAPVTLTAITRAQIPSRIHMHEITQQRIDLVVPALAGEHAVMADAGLHVMHLAIGAHAGAEVLRRQRLADRADIVLFALYRHQAHAPDRGRV